MENKILDLLIQGDIERAVNNIMKERPPKDYPRMPWKSFGSNTFKEAMRQNPDDDLIDRWAEILRLMSEDAKEKIEVLRKLIYTVNCETICEDGERLLEKMVNYLIVLAKRQGQYSQEYEEVYMINHKKYVNINEQWHD